MKNTLFLLIIIFSITIFSGCSDPCSSVTCLNGGICIDGICSCPNGYSGTNCEIVDPCLNVSCLNGGTCVNGTCVCATGYTGADCSQQITPTVIRISKITITRFPATDDQGGGWDLTSGADVFPAIETSGGEIWSSSTYFENASTSNNYSWSPVPQIELTSPTSQYQFIVYDYDDTSADDFMGGINWVPFNGSGGFPTTIVLDASGDVAFELELNYSF